ncbi:MAG: NAD(P)H-dependent oxidoreductase subunit E [Acidobacteria bacterium]|nr:NAD(P)H-dependent oxidoreductase subunit E [Acidobacteriota bacterium]
MATARLRSIAEPAQSPCRRHVFVVCQGEQCLHRGADELLDDLERCRLRTEQDLRIGASDCLGHCELAPAVVEDGQVLGAVTAQRLRVELLRLGLR